MSSTGETPLQLIRGGLVIGPDHAAKADLLIEGERIAAILTPDSAERWIGIATVETFDADGLLILPGLIDPHVHFNTGTRHVDTLPEAAMGAALGGLTTLVGHVRSTSGDVLGEIQRQRTLVGACPIDVAFHAIIAPEDDPNRVISALAADGIRSFKFFMAYRADGIGMDDAQLLAGLQAVARVGGVALVHAEDDVVIGAVERGLVEIGRTSISDYPHSRPPCAEVMAIRRVMALAEMAGATLYIVHTSTAEGLQAIYQEKQRHRLGKRPPVYAESCPQYMLLNEEIYTTLGTIAKIAPPLRPEEDRSVLFTAFQSGMFDAVGSDHSPHPLESKLAEFFVQVRAGAPGIQTLVPVLVSALLATDHQTPAGALQPLALSMSQRPAACFGLAPQKGRIAVGAHADFVCVDADIEWRIEPDWLVSNSGFSLFNGRALRGRPIHSTVRGRWVLKDGVLVSESGGQLV